MAGVKAEQQRETRLMDLTLFGRTPMRNRTSPLRLTHSGRYNGKNGGIRGGKMGGNKCHRFAVTPVHSCSLYNNVTPSGLMCTESLLTKVFFDWVK